MCSGGGSHNEFLIERIAANLPEPFQLVVPDKSVIDFKEAILMSLMGYLRIHGLNNVFKSVTGADADSCCGAIYKG